MNFSQVMEQGDVVVQLKYCERCGGLWLRCAQDGESYCENCRSAMAAWPRVGRRGQQAKTFNHRVHREAPGNRAVNENEAMVISTLRGVAEDIEEGEHQNRSVVPEVRI
jgi:hypothetical protein